jgi:hypothetical protein
MADYPTEVTVWIDGIDVTFQLFGVAEINPSSIAYMWRDIDISGLVRGVGSHILEIRTSGEGSSGQVDARIEIR